MSLLAVGLLLLGLVVIGVPIAVALGATAVIAMVTGPSGIASLPNAALVMFDGATSFPLIAIPLFILAGSIMNASGISRRLIAFASSLVGFIRGGLSMVTICASLFFAEISGSAVADVAALGSILIPAMERKGYSRAFATAVTCSIGASASVSSSCKRSKKPRIVCRSPVSRTISSSLRFNRAKSATCSTCSRSMDMLRFLLFCGRFAGAPASWGRWRQ